MNVHCTVFCGKLTRIYIDMHVYWNFHCTLPPDINTDNVVFFQIYDIFKRKYDVLYKLIIWKLHHNKLLCRIEAKRPLGVYGTNVKFWINKTSKVFGHLNLSRFY